MSYRILLNNLLTGTLLGEVRATAAKWSTALNGAGSAQVVAPTEALLATLGTMQQRVGNTCLVVVNGDGAPVWSGVVWAADVNMDNDTTLQAAGMLSILQRRVVRSTLTYTAADQSVIAAGLVNHAQDTASGTRPDRALNITTTGLASHGQARTRAYPAGEAANIGQALLDLAEMKNGFTFAFTPVLSADWALTHTLALTYPNSGVSSTAVLAHRSNCLVGRVSIDATAMASDVVATGGGAGAALVERRGAALAGWPCLEATQSWTDVAEAATLQALGDRVLALGRAPRVTPALQVLDVQAPVGLNNVCRLVVPPLGIDAQYRVVAVDTTLVGERAVTNLAMAPAALFTP